MVVVFGALIIFIAHWCFPLSPIAHWFSYVLAGALLITILQFFRHPTRKHTSGADLIVSPADGKVVVIEETTEQEYFQDLRLQVSIFMSPVNVHVNRYPISGVVSYFKYHAGKFLAAWEPKSSTDNERTSIVIKHDDGTEILFRQVAGVLARRIVWYCKEGDKAVQSGEMGFIKFGSRIDLYLPPGTPLDVKMGDTVKGGVSVIGRIAKVETL
jgi:phosphatidylserine decarboxylase